MSSEHLWKRRALATGCVAAIGIAGLGTVDAAPHSLTRQLGKQWRRSRDGARWRSPTAQDRKLVREAARYAAANASRCDGAVVAELRRRLVHSHFELEILRAKRVKVLLLREKRGARHGGGLYAFRCGKARPWILQAPHAFFDVGTGRLVRQLFVESAARAAYFNTVHRYRALPDERREDRVHPADVAHQFGSLFQAATVGAVLGDSGLRVIQLHGSDLSRDGFAAVVSLGRKRPVAAAVAAALTPAIGRVAAYGRDVDRLGGTTNVQGIALRRMGVRHFLHLELSRPARDRLKRDEKARALLNKALGGSWQ